MDKNFRYNESQTILISKFDNYLLAAANNYFSDEDSILVLKRERGWEKFSDKQVKVLFARGLYKEIRKFRN